MTPLDGLASTITAHMPNRPPLTLPRHALDAPGARWMWLWPLPSAHDLPALLRELVAHGVTGIVPQQSDDAVVWARAHVAEVRAAGLDLVVGLGRIDRRAVVDALDVPGVSGVMIDQEAWQSVPDSDALCRDVLALRPDAPSRVVDCHYPCLTTAGPGGGQTGHHRIAKAWSPLCGLRAPQCYWEGGIAPDGWVARRLAWARQDYPRAGGSPAERVRASVQLYRRSVADHVALLLAEGVTGSVWLWDWREADASARLALRVVHELEACGHRGPSAVESYQLHSGLTVDGIVGPLTCRALGLDVPAGAVWSHS